MSGVSDSDALKAQWAGGGDLWKDVPDGKDDAKRTIITRVKEKHETNLFSDWPEIVLDSNLYGVTAYNPRGLVVDDSTNEQKNAVLRQEIVKGSSTLQFPEGSFVYWDGAGLWEDGSIEYGFVVAFNRKLLKESQLDIGKAWIVDLAKKYEQGAIYEYKADSESAGENSKTRLFRSTVPVLVEDTDAVVEIVIAE